MAQSRRDHIEICLEILSLARRGAHKWFLVRKANLNFKLVNDYLNSLEKQGFLSIEGREITTTELGVRTLKLLRSEPCLSLILKA